jgi:uncharacterized protein (DUF2236 family)
VTIGSPVPARDGAGAAAGPVSRRINAERLVLLGWSRAILLQLAHPLIAAGVAEHSGFRASPLAAVARLHHTVRAMLALTFGSDEGRLRALDGIRAIHARVHGHLAAPVGPFPAGARYSAEDPALVVWVHATLLDSVPLVFDLLVDRLTDAERDTYCAEAAPLAIALGAEPREVPTDYAALREYLDRTYASGSIVVGPTARALAQAVMSPPGARIVAPAKWMNDLLTIGLLPQMVREQYGFAWSARRERALGMLLRGLRGGRRITPDRLALWRESRVG